MENDNTKNSTLPLPFAYQEKRNRLYFKDYKLLETFSPAVTSALANNCLTGTLRSEFIRDICTDISSHGIAYINKEERNKVSFAIVTKYPHLKDAIGSGLLDHGMFPHIYHNDQSQRMSKRVLV
ncbi:uncharacterized protein LOC124453192 [Xenia sp. Carnegie-2017]|uniref:uncharacterized protein LOC124453192 n=1 Tax=Xenia sp. Carnegie-2017 TaxID=2897299 RepID=UPI001F033FAC|nr:uncharacterized protein LOC124453192 [Xenia sp. Carnegie-2017]